MPRFGNGRRKTDWLTVIAIFGSGAGISFAAYLLAGLVVS
jgi:hypothetical protein